MSVITFHGRRRRPVEITSGCACARSRQLPEAFCNLYCSSINLNADSDVTSIYLIDNFYRNKLREGKRERFGRERFFLSLKSYESNKYVLFHLKV